jgi:hypothetical protein
MDLDDGTLRIRIGRRCLTLSKSCRGSEHDKSGDEELHREHPRCPTA